MKKIQQIASLQLILEMASFDIKLALIQYTLCSQELFENQRTKDFPIFKNGMIATNLKELSLLFLRVPGFQIKIINENGFNRTVILFIYYQTMVSKILFFFVVVGDTDNYFLSTVRLHKIG